MLRRFPSLAALTLVTISAALTSGQEAAPRAGFQPASGNALPRANTFTANKPVAMTNRIVKPIPLSADTQKAALTNLDKRITAQINDLADNLKNILPDELTILTKTTGWKAEDQQALVTALRAGDPTAVYETWVKGNPQDVAGAEAAARQTEVKKQMTRLIQDAAKNRTALKQDMADFDAALGKVSGSVAAVSDLTDDVRMLKTWIEARKVIDTAAPGKGAVAQIPKGDDVTLIFDPTLSTNTAVVLSEQAVLVGYEGHNSLNVTSGNAAEALGMPIVTGTPLPEAQGREVLAGVLLLNPADTQGTINYTINGNHYVAKPGMQQKLDPLPNGRRWVIQYDRGGEYGVATYTLSPGTYKFSPTETGWQLYKQRFEVTLDNSESSQEFNFIFQGEDMNVPAGGTRTLNSIYPVVVRFDRGNGSAFVAKTTSMGVGTLQVGVNATDNLWDLFPESGNRREASNVKPFNTDGRRNNK